MRKQHTSYSINGLSRPYLQTQHAKVVDARSIQGLSNEQFGLLTQLRLGRHWLVQTRQPEFTRLGQSKPVI